MKLLSIAIGAGIVLGLIGSKILFVGSAVSLAPWAIAGLLLGWFSMGWRHAVIIGACYGFALTFFFMIFSYSGTASPVTRIPFFVLLGLFGAICGLLLGLVGSGTKKLTAKKQPQ